jgi:2-polyprenyl-3-methyl-5-hydroxy-6-metoxy-1,4-benzoquinol methylase
LLDIGCGSFPLFLTRCSFRTKYGVDRVSTEDATAAVESDQSDQSISLVNFDLEAEDSLPFPDEHFEVITALAVLEHIDRDRVVPLLSEVSRLLKPGGQYILTTPARWTDGILAAMARLRLVSSAEIDEHKGAYSRGGIHSVLAEAGFDPAGIRSGHFEFFMNTWVIATK